MKLSATTRTNLRMLKKRFGTKNAEETIALLIDRQDTLELDGTHDLVLKTISYQPNRVELCRKKKGIYRLKDAKYVEKHSINKNSLISILKGTTDAKTRKLFRILGGHFGTYRGDEL